jgi:hypothetical protein
VGLLAFGLLVAREHAAPASAGGKHERDARADRAERATLRPAPAQARRRSSALVPTERPEQGLRSEQDPLDPPDEELAEQPEPEDKDAPGYDTGIIVTALPPGAAPQKSDDPTRGETSGAAPASEAPPELATPEAQPVRRDRGDEPAVPPHPDPQRDTGILVTPLGHPARSK